MNNFIVTVQNATINFVKDTLVAWHGKVEEATETSRSQNYASSSMVQGLDNSHTLGIGSVLVGINE